MRTAYQKSRLNDVQYLLGDYFNIAINGCYQTPENAYKSLLVSRYASLIAKGNTSVVSGKTGYELFYDVMNETNQSYQVINDDFKHKTDHVFWAGWILAYLQWATAQSFDAIYAVLPFETIMKLYHPYHEMDERHFVEDILERYFTTETNLKRIRRRNQLSQKELALRAKVSIRTIQMLEQRQNDINQTKAINLFNIAKELHCSMEDLLE